MIRELGKNINDIADLANLDDYFYETIFKVYLNDNFYTFNILRKVALVNDEEELDSTLYDNVILDSTYPWTFISYKEYGTINLWWIICAANKIQNPVLLPDKGTIIKVIKPQFVRKIISTIKEQLQK